MTAPVIAEFVCPLCRRGSRHPVDVAERYCPRCHIFVDLLQDASDAYIRGDLGRDALEQLIAGTGFTVGGVQRALARGRD